MRAGARFGCKKGTKWQPREKKISISSFRMTGNGNWISSNEKGTRYLTREGKQLRSVQ